MGAGADFEPLFSQTVHQHKAGAFGNGQLFYFKFLQEEGDNPQHAGESLCLCFFQIGGGGENFCPPGLFFPPLVFEIGEDQIFFSAAFEIKDVVRRQESRGIVKIGISFGAIENQFRV